MLTPVPKSPPAEGMPPITPESVSGGLDPALSGGGARGAQASAWFRSDLAFQKSCGGAASFASVARQELSPELVLNVDCVSGPDLIAKVVDQFEHGEGGLGAPVVGDLELDRLKAGAGFGCHELGALR